MDLNKIATFVRVVDAGSITRAATFLKQPKSRVSRSVTALERELGTSLLYRTTRQFSPTEAGRSLYERCRKQVYDLSSTALDLSESATRISGTLKLTTVEDVASLLLGPMLSELAELHPEVSTELHLTGETVDLVREGMDLAIRIGNLDDTNMKTRLIGQIRSILVASPEYLARSERLESLRDLARHRALVFSVEGEGTSWKLLQEGRGVETVRVRAHCRSNHPKVLLDLAFAGSGVALLPEFLCIDALKEGKLRRVLRAYSTRPVPIQFVWPAHREATPKVRAFVDLGVKRLPRYFSRRA